MENKRKMKTKSNISKMFSAAILKNSSILLLILFTSFSYAQKDKEKTKKEALKTEAKNFVRKGNKLYNQGNYKAAENAYKEAIALNPDYDKANYNFGNTQFLQNKIKEAKEQYDLVTKTTKDPFIKADTKHNLGNIAMKDKKYAEAVEAYKESLRNNPNDDETRYNLALAQKLLKEQQKKNDKNKDKNKDDKDKKDKDKKDKDKKNDKKDQKDKDKKDDKNKDKDKKDDKKDGDKDKKKDDKKDDGKGKNDKDKKEKQQPKPQQSKLSPEQVKQLLEAMNKEENKTQKKMNTKKARGRKVKQDKDW